MSDFMAIILSQMRFNLVAGNGEQADKRVNVQ